ncbi:hypothetical protein JTB14_008549 [Gonioctena quinquepunctata]|nr:hypothetical protein JTB14_008549 [Gonioctena quinquepunctata]
MGKCIKAWTILKDGTGGEVTISVGVPEPVMLKSDFDPTFREVFKQRMDYLKQYSLPGLLLLKFSLDIAQEAIQ